MIKHNQDGAVNSLVLALAGTVILFVVAAVFGIWAYGSRQDYKNNVQAKVNSAVAVAKVQEGSVLSSKFAQEEQDPLTTYNGPQAYGSLVVKYPKNWSGYVDTTNTGNLAVDAYFNPGVVPAIESQSSIFALRVQVINQTYSQTIQGVPQQAGVTSVAYSLPNPNLSKIVGVEVTGAINGPISQTTVILPLRSETLEIWTDGNQYLSDFNNVILKNFSFSP